MQLTNSYYYFQSVIPPETCQRIIDYGVEKIKKEKEEGYDTNAYTFGHKEKQALPQGMSQGEESLQSLKAKGIDPENVYVRDSEITWLTDQWLYDLIHPWIHRANRDAGWNFDWNYSEALQFTVYHGNEEKDKGGFYGWHKDGDSDTYGMYKRYIHGVTPVPLKENGQLPDKYVTDQGMVGKVRKISATINLNAPGDYEGGNLKFDFGHHATGDQFHECEEIRPQGSIIVFPSFMDHCVTPVTKGTRYSLVVWNLGPPFK